MPLFRFHQLAERGGGAAISAACSHGAQRDAGAAESPGAQGEGEAATWPTGGGVYRRKNTAQALSTNTPEAGLHVVPKEWLLVLKQSIKGLLCLFVLIYD